MNSPGTSFLFLGTTKFDGSDQSTSFSIAKELAKKNTVYYIDYPFTIRDCFRDKNRKQFKARKSYFSPFSGDVITYKDSDLKVIILPPLLSINFLKEGWLYRVLLKLNELIIRLKIKQVIRKNKIKNYIYFNSFNFHYPGVAKGLQPSLTVYHCVDPIIMAYDKKHGEISEKMLVENSDVVICTSRQLYSDKKLLNQNTYFIPNAADADHFQKALDQNTVTDSRITDLPKPVIGYIGTIERRLDYELLRNVVEQHPDKAFVFAGPVNRYFVPEWFMNKPNIHLIGPIKYSEIPSVLKGFDITIIPFKSDDVSATIFPLKLFEYLASGKPVVSTNFNPDLEEFTGDTVSYCDDSLSFSKALDNSLLNDDDSKRSSRIGLSSINTWKERAAEIEAIIQAHLTKN